MKKIIYLLTRNKDKILSVRSVFSKFGIEVKNIKKEFPEIQADSSIEIAKHSALEAAKEFKVPVIREDHSLFITALEGFPGPYTNYFDKKIPAEKILELLKNTKDRGGFMELDAAYAKPSGEVKEFIFRVPIKVSKKIQGTIRNWDRILMLENEEKTFVELKKGEHIDVWNKNYVEIAKEMLAE